MKSGKCVAKGKNVEGRDLKNDRASFWTCGGKKKLNLFVPHNKNVSEIIMQEPRANVTSERDGNSWRHLHFQRKENPREFARKTKGVSNFPQTKINHRNFDQN